MTTQKIGQEIKARRKRLGLNQAELAMVSGTGVRSISHLKNGKPSCELIAKAFGVSDKNDFSILERIGGECAGAVCLMPPGELPMAGSASYREISPEELPGKIAELPRRPLLEGQEGIRLLLAGAEGKLAIAIFGGKCFLPLNGSPSTHILKPQGPHFEGLVENEFFCMQLAALAGLEVAPVGGAGPSRQIG